MRISSQPFLLSLILLLAGSCVEPIVMDTHEDLPVAVYCVLKDADTQYLELYYAKGKTKQEYVPVTEAEVSLFSFDEKVAEFEYDGSEWKLDYHPQFGNKYRLVIQLADGEQLTAETLMPDNVDLFCFWHHYFPTEDAPENLPMYSDSFSYELRLLNRSPSHPDTYGTAYQGALNLWIYALNQWAIFPWMPEYMSHNELITTDHPGVDLFNASGISLKELPCFQEESLSQFNRYYRYTLNWMLDYMPDLPMCRDFVHINQPAGFNNGQDTSDPATVHYSTVSFLLSTNYVEDYESRPHPYLHYDMGPTMPYLLQYEFVSVSDELDHYLRDLYVRELNKDNLSMLYNTENVYSNVRNGLGIFGAEIRKLSYGGAIRGYREP